MNEDERRVLAFAATHPDLSSAAAQIRATFGHSAARYLHHLYRLVDRPDVEASDPELVHRIQRLRDARTAARASRRFAA